MEDLILKVLAKSLLVASSLTLAFPISFANAKEQIQEEMHTKGTFIIDTVATRTATVTDETGETYTAVYNKTTGDIKITSKNSEGLQGSKVITQSIVQNNYQTSTSGSFSITKIPEGSGVGVGKGGWKYSHTQYGSTKIAQIYTGAVAAVLASITGTAIAAGSGLVSYFAGVSPTMAYYTKIIYMKKVKGIWYEKDYVQWYKDSNRKKKSAKNTLSIKIM